MQRKPQTKRLKLNQQANSTYNTSFPRWFFQGNQVLWYLQPSSNQPTQNSQKSHKNQKTTNWPCFKK